MRSTLRLPRFLLCQEFQRWFGESRIVNADDTPKLVFHGTQSCFVDFRAKERDAGLGIHFGSLAQAEFFAGYDGKRCAPTGSNIRRAYLRIQNPLRLPDVFERGRGSAENVARWLCREGLISKGVHDEVCRARTARQANSRIVRAIRDIGHDGIVYENCHEGGTDTLNEDSYVVFDSGQIRPAF